MTPLRERWAGVSLPGDYVLEQWLSGDDAAGFFETSVASDGRHAVVKLIPESSVDGATQLALWRRTQSLRHPNLREMLDCGRAELSDEIVLFAVFEKADDTLASALSHAPLSEAEAREVLDSVIYALKYLQAQGLAHGALDPDHVVAVGDSIKLSSDGLREAPSDAPYKDELRTFWYRISPSTLARSADILARALGEEVHAVPPPAQAPAPAPMPAPVLAAAITPAKVAPARIAPMADAAPPLAAVLTSPPLVAPAPDSTPRPPHRFPKWVLAAAAGVVLVILGLNLRRGPEASAQRVPTPIVTPAIPTARPASDVKPSPVVKRPRPDTKQPDKNQLGKNQLGKNQLGKKMWRVIAYTYLSHDAAAKKADSVNKSHPGIAASVFAPKDKKGFYLVALGGFLTRDEAVRLQTKARTEGLARDVYIHNFLAE